VVALGEHVAGDEPSEAGPTPLLESSHDPAGKRVAFGDDHGREFLRDDAKREAFGETVISTIERYAPNIRRAIVGKQVITPKDIEMIAGITGGNIFHGELLLHQLFFLRPAPQWADFRTPLPGYYFGASGAHPGGGVMGAAGKLAAQEVLKDWK